jgi:type IV pilus assembly protein PilA
MSKKSVSRASSALTRQQRGFSLIELLFVLAVVAILTAVATPFVRALLIEGRVEPTAKDVINVTNSMRAAAGATASNTPYTTLGATEAATAVFTNAGRGKATALTITGAGATATTQHQLGATGSQVAVAQGTITTAGDSFTVTFPTVNEAACPGLANQLARVSEVITVNGTGVKAAGGAYNSATATNACTAGDTNAFVFTFR